MTSDVLTRHYEEVNLIKPPRLVDGHDLMKAFRLPPGPRIGELLEALKEAQAAGEVTGKQDALLYLKRLLAGDNNSGTKQDKE